MTIRAQARAKINWTLDVIGRRPDGYHELDMLMQTIALHDDLIFEPSKELSLEVEGAELDCGEKNLIIRAARRLAQVSGKGAGARILLRKRIPIRAGLGGGSSDCAQTLLALNEMWNLHYSPRRLLEIGAALGADVPFCLQCGLARVRGFGERLEWLSRPRGIPVLILHSGGGLSTPAVFAAWDAVSRGPMGIDAALAHSALMRRGFAALQAIGGNALEEAAVSLAPEIAHARRALREAGAAFVQMTGSGTAVFGAFDTLDAAMKARERLGAEALLTQTC